MYIGWFDKKNVDSQAAAGAIRHSEVHVRSPATTGQDGSELHGDTGPLSG